MAGGISQLGVLSDPGTKLELRHIYSQSDFSVTELDPFPLTKAKVVLNRQLLGGQGGQ